jgi:hypothetical protein
MEQIPAYIFGAQNHDLLEYSSRGVHVVRFTWERTLGYLFWPNSEGALCEVEIFANQVKSRLC